MVVVVVVVVGGGTHCKVLCELSVIFIPLQASTARSSVLRVTWHVAYYIVLLLVIVLNLY